MISHAYIDHIGRVPLLVKRGFAGPIFMQQAGGEPMPVMLLDSASPAESNAERANRKKLRLGGTEVVPLYTREDVEWAYASCSRCPAARDARFCGVW